MPKLIDLTGKRFGRQTVIEYTGKTKRRESIWKCQCDCGNIVDVCGSKLRSGWTKSCGCYKTDCHTKDITGQRFGKLVALELVGYEHSKRCKGSAALWKCQCDCGNLTTAFGVELRTGNVKSCGCKGSMGEQAIANWLNQHGIKFQKEKKFIQCKLADNLRYDFFLPDYGLCIEFDGKQHFIDVPYFHSTFENQRKRDLAKTQYCEDNDLILLRIRYDQIKSIDQILSEWILIE